MYVLILRNKHQSINQTVWIKIIQVIFLLHQVYQYTKDKSQKKCFGYLKKLSHCSDFIENTQHTFLLKYRGDNSGINSLSEVLGAQKSLNTVFIVRQTRKQTKTNNSSISLLTAHLMEGVFQSSSIHPCRSGYRVQGNVPRLRTGSL